MSRPAASVRAQPGAKSPPGPTPGEVLLRTFTAIRDELVSTLWFVLGNAEDAQDVAQEAFLRCWRPQGGRPDTQNRRPWISRVGLNAAKAPQRSAWPRRAKPLLGAEAMPAADDVPPAQALEGREELLR